MELQVKSKREDVMYAADRELAKARERLSATTEAIAAKEGDLRSSWTAAVATGVPLELLGGTSDITTWLSELSNEFETARAAEAAARPDQAEAGKEGVAGGGGPIVLLGKEVNEMLGVWEGRLAGVKDLLLGLLHCRHARDLEALLKGVVGGLQWPQEHRLKQLQRWGLQHRTHQQQQQRALQLQHQQQDACGEMQQVPQKQYLPQEIARACSEQFLECPAERRVLWRLMFKGKTCVGGDRAAAGCDLDSTQQQQQRLQTSSSRGAAATATTHQGCSSCQAVAAGTGSSTVNAEAATAAGEGELAGVSMLPSAAAALGCLLGESVLLMPSGAGVYEQAHKLLARGVLRAVEKRHATFAAKVSAAAAAAGGGGGSHGLHTNHANHYHQGEGGGSEATGAAAAGEPAASAAQLHTALQGLPLQALTAASDAVHAAVKLLKLHGALHVDQLREEVAMSDYEAAAAEAEAAAAGQLPAVATLVAEKTMPELRKQVRGEGRGPLLVGEEWREREASRAGERDFKRKEVTKCSAGRRTMTRVEVRGVVWGTLSEVDDR
jgi:hypothetical protein